MKWKTILALAAALLVLAAAFLLPGLSLRLQTWAALRTTLRQDASDVLLDPAPVDLVRKLRILTDTDAERIGMELEPEAREAVFETAERELQTLRDLGAVSREVSEVITLDHALWAVEYVLFYVPETNLTADFYLLHLWHDYAVIVLDRATGKILSLQYANGVAGMYLTDTASAADECAAWAAYFGLELSDPESTEIPYDRIRSHRNPAGTVDELWIASAAMSDAGGSTVRFGLHYEFFSYEENFLFWTPIADGN